MAKWNLNHDIGVYPSIGDGNILIIVENICGTRQIRTWLGLHEARKFGESIIKSVDECEHVIDARKLLNK